MGKRPPSINDTRIVDLEKCTAGNVGNVIAGDCDDAIDVGGWTDPASDAEEIDIEVVSNLVPERSAKVCEYTGKNMISLSAAETRSDAPEIKQPSHREKQQVHRESESLGEAPVTLPSLIFSRSTRPRKNSEAAGR